MIGLIEIAIAHVAILSWRRQSVLPAPIYSDGRGARRMLAIMFRRTCVRRLIQ